MPGVAAGDLDHAPFSGLAFKIMSDYSTGTLSFVRIYSGTLEAGATVLNPVRGKHEQVGRMLLMHANAREDIVKAYAGDIVALVGLGCHQHGRHAVRSGFAGRAAARWRSPNP